MATAGVDAGEVLGLHEVAGDAHATAEDVIEGHVGGEAAAGQTNHDEDPAVTPFPQGDLPGEENKVRLIGKLAAAACLLNPLSWRHISVHLAI